MSVATDLQTVISRIGIAVASGDSYTRVDLERLARELTTIRADAAKDHDAAFTTRHVLASLTDDIEAGTASLRQLAMRARERALPPIAGMAADAVQPVRRGRRPAGQPA